MQLSLREIKPNIKSEAYDDLVAMITTAEVNHVAEKVEWFIDIGATKHLCADMELFSGFQGAVEIDQVYMGSYKFQALSQLLGGVSFVGENPRLEDTVVTLGGNADVTELWWSERNCF
ncbi:unnamed protein product [Vicia faba]|uniref:Uncharacterized protein n=1 Tax=Vicia faba TaxID=3906 RepID=A0AAV0YFL5_VICFA|nr:unnamed protein product [Vicia faba]